MGRAAPWIEGDEAQSAEGIVDRLKLHEVPNPTSFSSGASSAVTNQSSSRSKENSGYACSSVYVPGVTTPFETRSPSASTARPDRSSKRLRVSAATRASGPKESASRRRASEMSSPMLPQASQRSILTDVSLVLTTLEPSPVKNAMRPVHRLPRTRRASHRSSGPTPGWYRRRRSSRPSDRQHPTTRC